jgi:hypothetical protein
MTLGGLRAAAGLVVGLIVGTGKGTVGVECEMLVLQRGLALEAEEVMNMWSRLVLRMG